MAEHIKMMLRKGTVLTRNESPCYGIAWKSMKTLRHSKEEHRVAKAQHRMAMKRNGNALIEKRWKSIELSCKGMELL